MTYIRLTEQMDLHDLARGRGSLETALAAVTSRVLVMGIDSDLLYPLAEQEQLAALIPGARLRVINSLEGHDGFLLEQGQVAAHIGEFLDGDD